MEPSEESGGLPMEVDTSEKEASPAQASSPSIQPVRYYRYSVVGKGTLAWSVFGSVTRATIFPCGAG
jgi:hypothetical protein